MRASTALTTIAVLLTAVPLHAQEVPKGQDPRIVAMDAAERANKLAADGRLGDAIPYYEKAIKLDGLNNELAYYNLAEVQKVRGNCRAAVLLYQLYASVVGTPNARKESDDGIKGCKTTGWPTVKLQADPGGTSEIFIDGMLAAADGDFGPVVIPPGSYQVKFAAADHHPATKTLEVGAEPIDVTEKLKKMTFFGTVTVKVDVPDARIRIFEGPSNETETLFDGKSPMKDGVKAREGRHFVEVTKEGYKRWIRNVTVGRDVNTEVEVALKRSLPPEIQ